MTKQKIIQELAKDWIGLNEAKEALDSTGEKLVKALEKARLDGVVIGGTALIATSNLFDFSIRHIREYKVIVASLDERAGGRPPGG
jgi:hypothetical protein